MQFLCSLFTLDSIRMKMENRNVDVVRIYCMYLYMYVYTVCMCMYAYIYTHCMPVCMVCIYVEYIIMVCTYVCMHACVYTKYICMYVCMYVCIYFLLPQIVAGTGSRAPCCPRSARRCFCSFWTRCGSSSSSFRPASSSMSRCCSFWPTTCTRPCLETSFVTAPRRGWSWGWWAIRGPFGSMCCRGRATSLLMYVCMYVFIYVCVLNVLMYLFIYLSMCVYCMYVFMYLSMYVFSMHT